MTIKDDRTLQQEATHTCFVKARDAFMSGWGGATNGTSYAVWACRPEHLDQIFDWVKNRSEMRDVTTDFDPDSLQYEDGDHLHIYAVKSNHPVLGDDNE